MDNILKDVVVVECTALTNPKARNYPTYKKIWAQRDALQLTFGVSIRQGSKLAGDALNNFFFIGSPGACAQVDA
jgi:hypothetical protein